MRALTSHCESLVLTSTQETIVTYLVLPFEASKQIVLKDVSTLGSNVDAT